MKGMIALIPARAGSVRIPHKNTRRLAGVPLLQYTIAAAQASGVFAHIGVYSDDREVYAIATDAGCDYFLRDPVPDDQPDIAWVRPALAGGAWNCFAILRPTSPFRTVAMLQRAARQFRQSEVHSIRAVQPVKEHPGKMWWIHGPGYPMTPVCGPMLGRPVPFHSSPTQTLPKAYVQNASLEMAWTYVVTQFDTIAGTKVAPFLTEGYEGFDLNTEADWAEAERLLKGGFVELSALPVAGVQADAAPVEGADPGRAVSR